MSASLSSKKSTVVILRWVLIIAFSYLLIVDPAASLLPAWVAVLIACAFASNLIIARLPEAWCDGRTFDFTVVLFDALWVTLGLMWAPNVSGDLFLLYFLVIFVAAVGESLPMIVGSAVVVAIAYGAMMSWHPSAGPQLSATTLLRVPFLFVVALFYGYFVTQIRGKRGEANEARLREHAKTELLAAVSHDLRGPLGNAENLLTLALETSNAGERAELLLRTQVNIRRVSQLVSNLLQTATIEAGKVHFQMAPVQLNEIVDDVAALSSGAAHLKGVTLRCTVDSSLPKVVADNLQLGRVLANLVDNAVKYTASGGTVTICTRGDDQWVRIEVQDTGPGLTADQCAHLFAAYQRARLATYTQGTGLGLYISKRLIEAQGGTVSVHSQVGVGSTFTVALPRTVAFNRGRAAADSHLHGTRPADLSRSSGEPVAAVAA